MSAGGAHPESPPGDLATEAQRLEVEEPGGPLDVQQIAIRRLADPLKLRPGRRPPGQLADQGVGEALGDAEQEIALRAAWETIRTDGWSKTKPSGAAGGTKGV